MNNTLSKLATITLLNLILLPSLSLSVLSQSPTADQKETSTRYNCLTREVWSQEKQEWCDRYKQLQNAKYTLPDIGSFELVDGKYDNRAENKNVLFAQNPKYYALGTLGDRANLVALVLTANTGGSGIFQYLVIANPEAEGDKTVAASLLGDRVIIESLELENGEIKIKLTQQGLSDPQCCPTEKVTKTFVLESDQLKEIKPEK